MGFFKIKKVSDSRAADTMAAMAAEIAASNHRRDALIIGRRALASLEDCNFMVAALFKNDKQKNGENIFTKNVVRMENVGEYVCRDCCRLTINFKNPKILDGASNSSVRQLFYKITGWQSSTAYPYREGSIHVFKLATCSSIINHPKYQEHYKLL